MVAKQKVDLRPEKARDVATIVSPYGLVVLRELCLRVGVFDRPLEAVRVLGALASPDDGEDTLLQRLKGYPLGPGRRVDVLALLLVVQPLYRRDVRAYRVVGELESRGGDQGLVVVLLELGRYRRRRRSSGDFDGLAWSKCQRGSTGAG